MFVHVKFVCDGKKAIVPADFIKDFDHKYDCSKSYEVFWSPCPEDTPLTILQKQGKILTLDEEMDTRKRTKGTPLAGYYLARILRIADSLENLENLIDSKEGRKGMASSIENLKEKTKPKDKKLKGDKLKGRRMTLSNLQSVFESSDSDDSVMPVKIHQEKVSELEEKAKHFKMKYKNLKTKYASLESNFNEVLQLNIELQKKLINEVEALSSSSSRPFHGTAEPSLLLDLAEAVTPVEGSNILLNDATIAINSQTKDEALNPLTENQLSASVFRVKPGAQGDSMFVKNLAVAIFGEEVLEKSSVTGQRCNAKKDSLAKPALCSEKMAYLKKLFLERLITEKCSGLEIEKRSAKVNSFVAEKIITLLRKK